VILAVTFALTFAWPIMLLSLLLAPALIFLYVRLLRGRARRAAELAEKGFRPNGAVTSLKRKRHIPFAFFIAGITALLFASARPQTTVNVPSRQGTVILAFDVSNSMRADDLKPTRMTAAKAAAKKFVTKQPKNIKIGIVAFSDGAIAAQQPSLDRKSVTESIDRLQPAGSTAIGQGIFTALNMISGTPIALDPNAADANTGADKTGESGAFANAKIGYFSSAAIVLLSDGEDRSELKAAEVAKLASVGGVKIYPIGIGTAEGSVVTLDGFQISTQLDEEGLKEIATITNGRYYNAADATELAKVYSSIDLEWKREPRKTEITGPLAALSSALLVLGAALSLKWFGRVV
jgi:Ca-activated chloride channel homolog